MIIQRKGSGEDRTSSAGRVGFGLGWELGCEGGV